MSSSATSVTFLERPYFFLKEKVGKKNFYCALRHLPILVCRVPVTLMRQNQSVTILETESRQKELLLRFAASADTGVPSPGDADAAKPKRYDLGDRK